MKQDQMVNKFVTITVAVSHSVLVQTLVDQQQQYVQHVTIPSGDRQPEPEGGNRSPRETLSIKL